MLTNPAQQQPVPSTPPNVTILTPVLERLEFRTHNPIFGPYLTQLQLAVAYNNVDSVRLLLEYQADPTARTVQDYGIEWETCTDNFHSQMLSFHDKSPLEIALINGSMIIAKLLIEHGASVNLLPQVGSQR